MYLVIDFGSLLWFALTLVLVGFIVRGRFRTERWRGLAWLAAWSAAGAAAITFWGFPGGLAVMGAWLLGTWEEEARPSRKRRVRHREQDLIWKREADAWQRHRRDQGNR